MNKNKQKHKIELDVNSIDNVDVINFINHELDQCTKNKITVELLKNKSDHIKAESAGEFNDYPNPNLCVNFNEQLEDWLPIFLHETCHKDQYLEKSDLWFAKIGNEYDALLIFDMWIDHHIELKPHQLRPVLTQIIEVELDCERRSVEKIKKFNLPINIQEYIQKSNSYIWYYHAAAYHRAYTQRSSPYTNVELWSKMPVDMDQNYSTINSKMLKLFTKYCY
jgi:hypothetical protein